MVRLELRTAHMKDFCQLYTALKETSTSHTLRCYRDGIVIKIMGICKIVYSEVLLGGDFDKYVCTTELDENGEEQSLNLHLSVHSMYRILKSVSSDDSLMWWEYEQGDDHLKVVITSENKRERRTYNVRLQEPNADDMVDFEVDGDDYEYVLSMPGAELLSICRNIKTFSPDHVRITHDGQQLVFSYKDKDEVMSIIKDCRQPLRDGNDSDDEEEEFGKLNVEADGVILHQTPADGVSCYSGDFDFEKLHNFSKCASVGAKGKNIVTMSLGQNCPLVIEFKIGTIGDMKIYLAPREDQEEL